VYYSIFKLLGKTSDLYIVLEGKQQHNESESVNSARWKTAASFASTHVTEDITTLCNRGVHGNFVDAIFSFPLPTENIITDKNIKLNPHSW